MTRKLIHSSMKTNSEKTPSAKPTMRARRRSGSNGRKKSNNRAAHAAANNDGEYWSLRLYVAGQTPRSLTAFANLKRICEEMLPGRYAIEIIDLIKQPQLAQGDQIVAIPTLVRKLPEPIKRVVGDLSNTERVIVGMDLRPQVTPHVR